MTQVFVELYEAYEAYKASTVNSVKSVLLDAMISYAKSYHEGYVCYDMDMYTTIYKCAFNDVQRSDVLNQIKSIIVDSALKNDELIENFKEFVSLTSVLKNDNVEEFDEICSLLLSKFSKLYDEVIFESFSGQGDFIPLISINEAKSYLRIVINLIRSTGRELKTLNLVNEVERKISIKHWDIRLCILHSLFSFY